jgi:aspartate aminotransferase
VTARTDAGAARRRDAEAAQAAGQPAGGRSPEDGPPARRLSANLDGVTGSETLRISGIAAQMRARGAPVVSLSAGEPDFPTPGHIREAGIEAIRSGRTRYTPTAGIPELRAAVAEKLERENGVPCAAENVVVTVGAKQAIFHACLALFGPGDEVLVPAPYWVSYPAMVRLARAVPVPVATADPAGKVTVRELAAAATSRTRGLLLNSPSNPTGAVYDERELAAIAGFCAGRDLWVISDEIYERLCYVRSSAPSIAALGGDARARTVTVNGFSKAFAMTGWRIGYAAAPPAVAAALETVQSHSTSNCSSVSQHAALAALVEREASDAAVAAMREEFRRRRDRLVEGLAGLPGVRSPVPDGAFYVFSDLRELLGGDAPGAADAFCERLLREHALALVPGGAFGAEGRVRWSFAASDRELAEGVERFRRAVLGGER